MSESIERVERALAADADTVPQVCPPECRGLYGCALDTAIQEELPKEESHDQ